MAEETKKIKTNYHAVIPWHTLKKHFEGLERKAIAKFRSSAGDELLRIQGELQLLDRLANLPEALILTEEEEPAGS